MTGHAERSFPSQPEQVSAAWLTEVLQRSGALQGAQVVALRATPVGNGLLGQSVRFALELDRSDAAGPRAVVAKFAATEASPRALCVASELYLREVRFYQQIAPTIGTCTPRVYAADIDPGSRDYILLMEDLHPARQGDQLAGCSVDECRLALQQIAPLHAAYWQAGGLEDLPWLRGVPERVGRQAAALPAMLGRYLQRFGDRLAPEAVAALERFVPRYGRIVSDRVSPWMLQHGDFRLDNVLFDVRGEAGTMATLDWQTINAGCGLFDAAFFVGGALPADRRRQVERELVAAYHDTLCRLGVHGYAFDDCWRDYRKYAARSLYTPIAAGLAVAPSERGDRMFIRMMDLVTQQVIDLDSLSLWD